MCSGKNCNDKNLKRLNVHPKNIIKTYKTTHQKDIQTSLQDTWSIKSTRNKQQTLKQKKPPTPWFQAARFQVEDLHQDVPSYWKTKHQVLGTRLLSPSWPASKICVMILMEIWYRFVWSRFVCLIKIRNFKVSSDDLWLFLLFDVFVFNHLCFVYHSVHGDSSTKKLQQTLSPKKQKVTSLPFMDIILHRLRLVVYPISFTGFYTSLPWLGMGFPSIKLIWSKFPRFEPSRKHDPPFPSVVGDGRCPQLDLDLSGVSKNSGVFPPKSSIFIGVFHYKPSILGYPYFW